MPDTHPVWDVYDLQRTARLNVKFYSHRLAHIERSNFWFELILAITAPSSAIAGLFFWELEYGQLAWKLLLVLASIIAILKPLLKLTDKIKKYEESLTGYRMLEHDLSAIATQIKQKEAYTPALQKEFNKAFDRKGKLSQSEAERSEHKHKKLREKLQSEVCIEMPADLFYIPL